MKIPTPRQQFHKRLKQKKTEFKGNPLLKREDVHFEFTPEMLEEVAKCEADPIYFIEKYMKIASLNHEDYEDAINGLIPFKLYPYQKKIIRSFRDYRMNVVVTARQAGKDLDITTPINTPNGWKTIKDIDIGDQVFGSDGKPINVIGISPIFKNHLCYRLTFSDNCEITCSEEHLWTVWNETKQKEETLRTADIAESKDELYIKNAKPLDYGTSYDRSDIDYFKEGKYWQRLKESTIPEHVMKASLPNRILFLQGMCEAGETMHMRDGECNIGFGTIGNCFKEKFEPFIESVYEFLVSMGSYCRIRYMQRNKVTFAFSISKEQFPVKRWKPRRQRCGHQIEQFTHPSQHMRKIVNIVPVASVLTKCISVDSPDQLFCVGYNNILTHNSTIACGFILWYILFNEAKKVGILANKEKTALEILNKVRIAYQYLPLWLKQGTKEFAKEKIILENESMVMAASTSSDSIRGWTLDLLFIDECAHIDKWDDFYTSTVPTIMSGKRSKLILVSTPNGMNHFYDFCRGAEYEKTDPQRWNGFHINKVMWNEVPDRGKIWYKHALAALGNDIDKFRQENECILGNTKIKVRNKETGEILEINVEELYNSIKNE